MKVRVTPLRSHGRRSRDGAGTGVLGELKLHTMQVGSVMHRVAQLIARDERSSKDQPLLQPLYEPEIVAVGAESMLLRGFESADGAGFVQEWHCEIVAWQGYGTLPSTPG